MVMVPPKVFPVTTNLPSGLTGVCTGNPPIRPSTHYRFPAPIDQVIALKQGDVLDLLPWGVASAIDARATILLFGPFMTDIEWPR